MITWIDKKSVLRLDKRFYKAGDEIPAGSLSPARIELLKSQKKIRIGEEKKPNIATAEIYGVQVEAEILPQKEPEVVEEEKPRRVRRAKPEEVIENDNSSEG